MNIKIVPKTAVVNLETNRAISSLKPLIIGVNGNIQVRHCAAENRAREFRVSPSGKAICRACLTVAD